MNTIKRIVAKYHFMEVSDEGSKLVYDFSIENPSYLPQVGDKVEALEGKPFEVTAISQSIVNDNDGGADTFQHIIIVSLKRGHTSLRVY